jgi:hypothetical protein
MHTKYIGKKFGKLTILEIIPYHKDDDKIIRTKAKCLCDCGNEKIITLDHIKRGSTSSCGCLRGLSIRVGQKIDRLFVLEIIPHHYDGNKRVESKALCRCDCGVIKTYYIHNILKNTKSCGCLKRDIASTKNFKHGLSNHPLYWLWHRINNRCYNKNAKGYLNYGGRGINNYWKDDVIGFVNYIKTILGPKPTKKHSLDRINNNENYEPDNIRWATPKEQCNNKTHAYQRYIEKLEKKNKELEKKVKTLERKVKK